MNKKLKVAIDAGDVDAVRVAIRAIADEDVRRDVPLMLDCANEADRELSAKGKSVYEDDDGRFTMPPESEWNEDLLHRIRGGLDWNFSRWRLECLQKVTAKLHEKQKTVVADPFVAARERTEEDPRPSKKRGKRLGFWLLSLAAIAAVALILFHFLSKN